MKNTIKKAEMRGQFIDMQKTRGGIPARLKQAPSTLVAYRNLLKANGIPYVIGQTGWTKCSKPEPIEHIFVHYTDNVKANDLHSFMSLCDRANPDGSRWVAEHDKKLSASLALTYQEQNNFTLTPKYQKILKKLKK